MGLWWLGRRVAVLVNIDLTGSCLGGWGRWVRWVVDIFRIEEVCFQMAWVAQRDELLRIVAGHVLAPVLMMMDAIGLAVAMSTLARQYSRPYHLPQVRLEVVFVAPEAKFSRESVLQLRESFPRLGPLLVPAISVDPLQNGMQVIHGNPATRPVVSHGR